MISDIALAPHTFFGITPFEQAATEPNEIAPTWLDAAAIDYLERGRSHRPHHTFQSAFLFTTRRSLLQTLGAEEENDTAPTEPIAESYQVLIVKTALNDILQKGPHFFGLGWLRRWRQRGALKKVVSNIKKETKIAPDKAAGREWQNTINLVSQFTMKHREQLGISQKHRLWVALNRVLTLKESDIASYVVVREVVQVVTGMVDCDAPTFLGATREVLKRV